MIVPPKARLPLLIVPPVLEKAKVTFVPMVTVLPGAIIHGVPVTMLTVTAASLVNV